MTIIIAVVAVLYGKGRTSKLYQRGPRDRAPLYGIFENSVNKYFSAPRYRVAFAVR